MRSQSNDITEIFGYSPDDMSQPAQEAWKKSYCQFVGSRCTKSNHDQSIIYGVCSVTAGSRPAEKEVIICPKRIYADHYAIFNDVAKHCWRKNLPLVVKGTIAELSEKSRKYDEVIVAFGQGSGSEIGIRANGRLSIDWILQRYIKSNGKMMPQDYVGIEVQSIDITGNYRECWTSYSYIRNNISLTNIMPSQHGLNWANVHKRLIPQIIRKGTIYSKTKRCAGFYFIVPEIVYHKFDEVIGKLEMVEGPAKDVLSIMTVDLGGIVSHGKVRNIIIKNVFNHKLSDVAFSFVSNSSDTAPKELDNLLKNII